MKLPLTTLPAFFSSLLFLLFLFLFFSSAFHSSFNPSPPSAAVSAAASHKLPSSVAETLVHYATSAVVPQQTLEEVSVTARLLLRKSPCNFLVFGLGHDSLLWAALNHGGRTVFLEEDETWIEKVVRRHPQLRAYHIHYDTKVKDHENLMEEGMSEDCRVVAEDVRSSPCTLTLKQLPREVYHTDWDVIMVDAPTGFHPDAPGRMGAIYTSGIMARAKGSGDTDILVHDIDRTVEDSFSMAFLCKGYLIETQGRLRHFTVPTHVLRPARPFCP